ncbi:MAG TPA: two-component regulator propeller domain-containing protein [Bacteroidia bacterium]|nr:two-component regulator propeller domain-containing protein [Bacteroidia bacterium]HNU32353.1 two-component regulator propeller domain-containing protein [Bacteroidia bacterium]
MSVTRFLIVTSFIIAYSFSHGQEKNIALKQYTSENGLSDNQVTCTLRDPLGFMWIGTKDGLNRFDGREFYVFKHNENDTQSICGNSIKCIELDADSLLWIGTAGNGFCSYDFRTGKFKTFNKDNSPLNSNTVNDITYDRYKNILWLGLNHWGLQVYDLKTNRIKTDPVLVSKNTYYDVELKDSIAYFAGIIESLKRIEKIGKFRTKTGPLARTLNKIVAASDGKLWCGAWDNGLHEFDTETKLLNSFSIEAGQPIKPSGDEVVSIAEDANKILWCGTKTSGVHFFDLKTKAFSDKIKLTKPITTRINHIYKDNFNRMWLATEGGLYCYDPLLNQFEITHLPVPPHISSCKVNDRIIIPGGKEFVITHCGLFYKNAGDAAYRYKEIIYRNERLELTTAFADSENKIWIGANRSVFLLDTITAELNTMPASAEMRKGALFFMGGTRINTLGEIKHHNKNYIIASYYGIELVLIDIDRKNFFFLRGDTSINNLFMDNLPRKILIDSKNNFWYCGVNNGITRLKLPDGVSLTDFPYADTTFHELHVGVMHWAKKSDGKLKVNNAFDMLENDDNSYWVTTQGNGLVKFFPENTSAPFISYSNQLKSLQGMARSNEENLWIISSTGLLHYNTATNRYKLFDAKSGVNEIVSGFFFKNKNTPANLLSAGFNGGFISFNPAKILRDTEKPSISVSKLWVMDAVSDTLLFSELKLAHNKNFIKFYLSSNCFSNNEQVTYYYRLSGIDEEWRSNEHNPLVTYTNLPPGNFLFEYKATNSDGVQSEVKSLPLIIIPPFYQTWYFYALVAAAAAAIIYTIYKLRINQVLKLQEVRNKIARDLHDDIGSTIGGINIYSQVANVKLTNNGASDVKSILEKIEESSREIIDKTADAVWAVSPHNDSLKNLVMRMEAYAASLLGAAHITFKIDCDENLYHAQLEMNHRKNLFLIYKEAIHNILKYAHATHVNISIIKKSNKLQMVIADDGKGIDKNKNPYNGNGIKNMKARAEELNGSFEVVSSAAQGTRIEVFV